MSEFNPERDERLPESCEQYSIPAGKLTFFDENDKKHTITIDDSGLYILPGCPESSLYFSPSLFKKDPFYGSVTPIAYTAAATTVMSWLLLILLFLSQKRRPWLQKFALLMIAITLTASLTATTDKVEEQYYKGYQDADELRAHVFAGLTFKILRVISVVLLWMAHVQVALRLFANRYREEVLIKGIGAVLIVLDVIFKCLADFLNPIPKYRDRFHSPIYIISTVLEMVIVVAYASAVVIYSVHKRKYAYDFSIWSVATLSLASVVAPLAFIIMGMSNYWFCGWSDMASRVCSAATSVVVWDWVDAIERLEKQEQKRAFMGRKLRRNSKQCELVNETNNDDEDNNNNNNDHNDNENRDGGDNTGIDDTVRFSTKLRSKWRMLRSVLPAMELPRRGGSAGSGSTVYDNIGVTAVDSTVAQDDNEEPNHDSGESVGELSNGRTESSRMAVHYHPVRRSKLRHTTIASTPDGSNNITPSNDDPTANTNTLQLQRPGEEEDGEEGDNDDDSLYIIPSRQQHLSGDASTRSGTDQDHEQETEENPPDFFAPVHGFKPGDYFDDKAPLPGELDDGRNAGPSS